MLAFSWGSTVSLAVSTQTLLAVFIPVVVAFVAKYRKPGDRSLHAILALVLSALLAVWAILTDDKPDDTVLIVVSTFLGVFVPQLVAYAAVWQPILKINAKAAPTFGIGGSPQPDNPNTL